MIGDLWIQADITDPDELIEVEGGRLVVDAQV